MEIKRIGSAAQALTEAEAMATHWHTETHITLRLLIYCAQLLEKILYKVDIIRD